MDPETKELLKESIALGKENNEMLKKLIRAQKIATIYRVVYWSIIILSSLGAYYFIEPYLGNVVNLYSGGVAGSSSLSDITKNLSGERQQFEDLLQ